MREWAGHAAPNRGAEALENGFDGQLNPLVLNLNAATGAAIVPGAERTATNDSEHRNLVSAQIRTDANGYGEVHSGLLIRGFRVRVAGGVLATNPVR